uniref:Ventricular zone expressed PH domain containing 1 n=1 Tax=Ovis aries TaxID=9940 RepID=A0AC11DLJ0_SHEEP
MHGPGPAGSPLIIKPLSMHQLFRLVLGQKDLSRAGDLFSLEDSEIEDSLTEALEQIKIISSSSDYQTNNNDQAVVEICLTRITTAIRETESIEKHAKALVGLWDSCLEHNLRPSGKDEDTPHAKIASDIMSCILQNYNRPPVMALAIPIAVKFLHRGNKGLCRNMSNYLSLAAITKADLLADHTEVIVKSILQGAAQMGPCSWGNHSISDQSVFLSTHHKHYGPIAEVQLDLIWIPFCAIGKQDCFV